MERLTTKRKDGRWALRNDDGATPKEQINKIPRAIDRLAAYEDTMPLERAQELAQAEKDGRLVVLPVNPYLKPTQQNEMYICENGEVWAIYVTGCEAGPNSDGVVTVEYMTLDGDVFSADDIGKTVFLTREEAEVELKKREADNEKNDSDRL